MRAAATGASSGGRASVAGGDDEAIAAHRSQLPKLDLESSRDLARAMGRISGHGFAEAYEVLRVRI